MNEVVLASGRWPAPRSSSRLAEAIRVSRVTSRRSISSSPVWGRAFVSIEMKYAEGCNDAMPRNINPRHLQIAIESGFVTRPGNKALLGNPHQQLLREMALMQSMIDADLFDSGQFIVIAPASLQGAACPSSGRAGQLRASPD